jgi:hypothetical protein
VAPTVVEFSLKLKYIWQILVNLSNIRFHENLLSISWVICGWTNIGKLTAFYFEYDPLPPQKC